MRKLFITFATAMLMVGFLTSQATATMVTGGSARPPLTRSLLDPVGCVCSVYRCACDRRWWRTHPYPPEYYGYGFRPWYQWRY
jgi:hypothetical protein